MLKFPTVDDLINWLLQLSSSTTTTPIIIDNANLVTQTSDYGHGGGWSNWEGCDGGGGGQSNWPQCIYYYRPECTRDKCFALHGLPPRPVGVAQNDSSDNLSTISTSNFTYQ